MRNAIKKCILACLFLLAGCSPKKVTESVVDVMAYTQEIDAWHQERIKNLQGPNGWLNVSGLYWLKDGINSFGSGPENDIGFPSGKIAEKAGFFMLKQGIVSATIAPGVPVTSGGKPFMQGIIFHPDSSVNPSLESGSLKWFIIKRDTKYGVRLRDFESQELTFFAGVERFPVDPLMRLDARWDPAPIGRTIMVTNILGQTTPQESPGSLVFAIGPEEFRLDALDEGGDEYFIIFGDNTNTKETYGAGRYLYVKKPDASGQTILDFNKAYNPPCAFTAFATCPLPPRQNLLPISILAGEKNYDDHE